MIMIFSVMFLASILVKDKFFLGGSLGADSGVFFLVTLFPLISLLLLNPNFVGVSLEAFEAHRWSLLFILFFLLLSFCSTTSYGFLLNLEICVIIMMLFIFRFSKDMDKISSAIFMFVLNMMPSILFMYFSSSSSFLTLENFQSYSVSLLEFSFFLGLLASKLPVFLIHFWLTKAHVSSSGPGSMVLASLLLKIGCVGLYNFSGWFSPLQSKTISFFMSLTAFGSLLTFFVMLRFVDLKFMVASSSITHMAFIFPFLLYLNGISFYCCSLMIVGHGIISFFIFFLVSEIYEGSQNKSSYFNKSLESSSGFLACILSLFFIMNMGFPPFMTFMSELFFCFLSYDISILMLPSASLGVLLGGLLFFFSISKMVFGKKSNTTRSDLSMLVNIFSLIFLMFFFFLFFLF